MTSKIRINQLEKKYYRISNIGMENVLVVRKITQGGRLMNEEGYLLNETETRKTKEEDEAIRNSKGTVVYLTSYSEPKIRV